MKKTSYLVASGALLLSHNAIAQESDAPIDASFIQPYEASFSFYLEAQDGSRTPGGTWTDSVQIEESVLGRTVVRYNPDSVAEMRRVVLADRTTLYPQLMDQRFGESLSGIFRAEFGPDSVRQTLVGSPTSPAQDLVVDYNAPVREISLWATLAMSVPFETGGSFEVPVIAENRRAVANVTVNIGASETITVAGEEYEATQVTMPDNQWTFWLRKEAPYILRIEHPGPNDTVAVSELESFELQ